MTHVGAKMRAEGVLIGAGLLSAGAQSWAETPADPAPFRGASDPPQAPPNPSGGVRLLLDGRAGVVGMFTADRSAADSCPDTRTCVVIRDTNAPGAVFSHHVFARGELFVTRVSGADLTVDAEGPGRYRVDVTTLDKPVLLTLARGRDVVKRDCCYPESSLSGFLRFQRRAESGIGLCAESRRCANEELEWFSRR